MGNGTGMQAQSSTGSSGLRTEARIMPSEPNVMQSVKTGNGDRKWETLGCLPMSNRAEGYSGKVCPRGGELRSWS